ncbi:MAG: asparagine synthase-related protein [Rhodothermales bacterium]
MTEALAHRGGHAACWSHAAVGLGLQSRTAAAGPITSGPLALVADARIDNRVELIAALSLPGPASEVTDEALILAAYERWGDDCPAHLIGAFAFALWDERRRTLLCARDHLGIRPFYYHRTDAHFAFGSEIKALLALGVPRQVRAASVADFLLLQPEDKEATFYEGVLRLPPAHTLTVTPDGLQRRRYWSLDPDRTLDLGSDEAYAEAFYELFDEAVRCRLRGPAPVGSTLSGGLDSSSITVLARDRLAATGRDPLDTFSLVFDEVTASDERRYIQSVLDQGGLRPHLVHGDRIGVFEELDRMLAHLDEPFFGPNLFLHWGLYRSAQQQGVGVLLDGVLGDSVVYHGDVYLTELVARGRWLAFGRELRPTARKWGRGWKGLRYVARRYVWTPLVSEPLRRTFPSLPWRPHPNDFASTLLNPEFARNLRDSEQADFVGTDSHRSPRSVRAAHYDELTSGLLPAALEVMDRAVAAFGIEARYPFADRRLVEFCLALPPTQRFRQGRTRDILRRAMHSHLPEPIRTRNTKGNLSHVLAHSLRDPSTGLRDFVEDRLSIAEPYLDVDVVRRAYRAVVDDRATGQARMALWQAAVLVRWLEREREAPSRANHPDLHPST